MNLDPSRRHSSSSTRTGRARATLSLAVAFACVHVTRAAFAELPPVEPAPLAPVANLRDEAPEAASHPLPPPWRGPTADALLPTGIAGAGVAAPFLVLGALSDSDGRGLLLGTGFGALGAAIPMIVSGATDVDYERRSNGALVAGSILVSVGASVSGGAIGTLVGNEIRYAGMDRIEQDGGYTGIDRGYFGHAVFAGIGASVALGGSLLMVFGATEKSAERKAEDRREEEDVRRIEADARSRGAEARVPRSVPRRTAGQVLVGIGAASTLGAVVSGLAVDDSGDFGGIVHFFTTIPLAVNAGICTAIGVPLWVTGAEEVPNENDLEEDAREDAAWIPAIAIGAGQASMTMRF